VDHGSVETDLPLRCCAQIQQLSTTYYILLREVHQTDERLPITQPRIIGMAPICNITRRKKRKPYGAQSCLRSDCMENF